MQKVLTYGLLVGLLLMATGCSLPQLQGRDGQTEIQQKQTKNTEIKKEKSVTNVQLAQTVAGQKDNPVLSPDDQGGITAGIQETLTTLIAAMRIMDLSKADTVFYGLDEAGSVITMEKLQLEVETLHPVEWRVESSRPAGEDSRLVEVSFTMPNGSLYQSKPFNMVDVGGVWMIHYNSFAASFHSMAEHLLGMNSGDGDNPAEIIF